MKGWITYILLGLILGILVYNLFQKPEQIKPETVLNMQRQVIREELAKILKDSLTIERYYHTKEVMKEQLTEFEEVDSLKKDSLFWFYYLSWKSEKGL